MFCIFSYFNKKIFRKQKEENKDRILPNHLGVIMDGNGRWAKKRSLPRKVGHSYGAKKFEDISIYCNKIGIKYATFYAFSTENWKRPKDEVEAIMKLMKQYLRRTIDEVATQNIKLNFIGDLSVFDDEIKELIATTRVLAKEKTGMLLNIAINYGGRDEIISATKNIAQKVKDGELNTEDITEKTISDSLYTHNQPDVDLIIRTSGEYRTSNFLMWQSAYAEYFFTETLWPDFTIEILEDILNEFSKRNRRYGGIDNG